MTRHLAINQRLLWGNCIDCLSFKSTESGISYGPLRASMGHLPDAGLTIPFLHQVAPPQKSFRSQVFDCRNCENRICVDTI